MREILFILHSYKFTHGYCISSRVRTKDMTPQFLICQVDLFEDDRKVTQVQAVVSYMYVS